MISSMANGQHIRQLLFIPITFLLALPGCLASPPRKMTSPASGTAAGAKGCQLLPDQRRSTIVIFEPSTGRKLTCNEPRSRERFAPASTYKIPHTLIAFETRAVVDENYKFGWDNRSRGVAAWDKSLSIAEAVPASAVWVFQNIAEKVGQTAEAAWVKKFRYGNENTGDSADLKRFWLSGPLKISADEQIEFLKRLRSGDLPASPYNIDRTISMLRLGNDGNGTAVYGKTGAMLPIDDEGFLRPQGTNLLPVNTERTGWFVGWLNRPEKFGGPVYFALNLDLEVPGAMNARTDAAYAVLEANGFRIPSQQANKRSNESDSRKSQ